MDSSIRKITPSRNGDAATTTAKKKTPPRRPDIRANLLHDRHAAAAEPPPPPMQTPASPLFAPRRAAKTGGEVDRRPPLSEDETIWLFAAIIRHPSLLERAATLIQPEHFGRHEYWLQLLWNVVHKYYVEFGDAIEKGVLVARVNAALELASDNLLEGDEDKLDDFLQVAYDLELRDMPEHVAIKSLQRYLEDQLRCMSVETLSIPQTPANTAAVYGELYERAMAIQAIGGDDGLTWLNTVTPRPVEWLWDGRVAIGKLTLLYGGPGLGKSHLTIDIAARISRGDSLPGEPESRRRPGRVMIITSEDDAEDTIRPRLDAYGGDASRVGHIRDIHDLSTQLHRLERRLLQYPDVKLVVIDPISEFIGADVDSHNEADVRRVLSALGQLARKHRVAIVLILHTNKRPDGSAQDRAMGSRAYMAVARTAWLISRDGQDQERVLMACAKNNIGPSTGNTLAFRLRPLGENGEMVVCWEGATDITADEALAAQQPRAQRQSQRDAEGRAKILAALAAGPAAKTKIRKDTGMRDERIIRLLQSLTSEGLITSGQELQRGQMVLLYRLRDSERQHTEQQT